MWEIYAISLPESMTLKRPYAESSAEESGTMPGGQSALKLTQLVCYGVFYVRSNQTKYLVVYILTKIVSLIESYTPNCVSVS